jgi:hypothetical protein
MNEALRWKLGDIVDLERYPITDLESPAGRALVARFRLEFTDAVSCALPGFVRPQAVAAFLAEVEAKEERAFRSSRYRSPYGTYRPVHDEEVRGLSADDPHIKPQLRIVHYLAYDEFGADSILHRLYEAPELAAFAAAVLEVPAIYPAADPLMAAPVSLHYEGCELGWHCDTQEFTITVMFRPSEGGGQFQYYPLAGPKDANFAKVPDVLAGDTSGVRTVPFEAGTIVLFRGANTLHRVTPTRGGKPRVLSVFHFEQVPGRMFDDQFKLDVFGRVA